jgi:hypothetical protein
MSKVLRQHTSFLDWSVSVLIDLLCCFCIQPYAETMSKSNEQGTIDHVRSSCNTADGYIFMLGLGGYDV